MARKADNPCIDVCKFDNDVCHGCGRTKTEVRRWKRMSDEERRAVLVRLGVDQADAPKKVLRKRRKLDAKILKLETKLAGLKEKLASLDG